MATTVFSLPNTTVWNSGTTTSPDFTFGTGITLVTTQFSVQPPGITDSTLTMTFSLMAELSPGSGVFTEDHGFTWHGDMLDPKHGNTPAQPSITVDVGPLAGLKCHVIMVLSKSMTAGVVVTES